MRGKCRCDACRAANTAYQRDRARKYWGVRRALTRGDDLDFLRRQLKARDAVLAASDLPRGEVRGRRDEIARFLELIDDADAYREQLLRVAS
ncbi:hypothetical protein GCM10009592_28440 [Brachybacterium rhamnosum]